MCLRGGMQVRSFVFLQAVLGADRRRACHQCAAFSFSIPDSAARMIEGSGSKWPFLFEASCCLRCRFGDVLLNPAVGPLDSVSLRKICQLARPGKHLPRFNRRDCLDDTYQRFFLRFEFYRLRFRLAYTRQDGAVRFSSFVGGGVFLGGAAADLVSRQ